MFAIDRKYGVDLVQQCRKDLTHQWSMLHWEISPTYGIKTETQAGAAAEAALTAATQTEMGSSVAAATQTELPLRVGQKEVATQTERSKEGTPRAGIRVQAARCRHTRTQLPER